MINKVLLIHDCNASGVFNMIIKVLLIHDCNASGVFNMINKAVLALISEIRKS